MNTTMRAAAPTQLRRLATGGLLALVLLGATAGLAAPASAAHVGAGGGKVSMQDLTRRVNEYEGQHRLGVAGDPSQWGIAGGKDPEFPSTPGVATGKEPEVPVVSN